VRIREARPDDAEDVIALFERLYSETSFLLYEPKETVRGVEEYARRMREAAQTETGVMYVAEIGGGIVGVLFGNRGMARRKSTDTA
jgi:Acetyltransferase (GNAT) domain